MEVHFHRCCLKYRLVGIGGSAEHMCRPGQEDFDKSMYGLVGNFFTFCSYILSNQHNFELDTQ